MRTYTRTSIAGGTYFFTVNLAERKHSNLLVDHIDDLREAFRLTQRDHPFTIDAIVVLPDHLHCLWTLPPGDANYPGRWLLIKARFSRSLTRTESISVSRQRRGERGIWQRRYWEHAIRDDRDFDRHADYIHFNPVKHGYVSAARDWPHSSFHRWVKRGFYSDDWAAPPMSEDWE